MKQRIYGPEYLTMTKYGKHDLEWVKNQISLHGQEGLTSRELETLSKNENTNNKHAPRSEKAPGRDKINQILKERTSIDWDRVASKGGRGKRAAFVMKKLDESTLLKKTTHYVAYQDLTVRLRSLENNNHKKFDILDCFEFVRVKNQLLAYPMKVYHYGITAKGTRKDFVFESVVSSVEDQLEKLKKIEKNQRIFNRNFSEIVKNIESLNNSCLDLAVVFPKNHKEHFVYVNAIKRLLK